MQAMRWGWPVVCDGCALVRPRPLRLTEVLRRTLCRGLRCTGRNACATKEKAPLAGHASGAGEDNSPGWLEVEFRAQLEDASVESRGELAEIAGTKVVANASAGVAAELRVVPGVEALDA